AHGLPLPGARLKRGFARSPFHGDFMDIRFVTDGRGDALAVMAGGNGQLLGAAQALDAQMGGRLTKAAAAARVTRAPGHALDIFAPDGVDFARVLVIGLGALDRADGLAVERWAASAVKRTLASGATRLVLQPDALPAVSKAEAGSHAAFGARLASYRFDSYRTKLKPEQKPTLEEVQIAMEATAAPKARFEKDGPVVDGVFLASDLVSRPANVVN